MPVGGWRQCRLPALSAPCGCPMAHWDPDHTCTTSSKPLQPKSLSGRLVPHFTVQPTCPQVAVDHSCMSAGRLHSHMVGGRTQHTEKLTCHTQTGRSPAAVASQSYRCGWNHTPQSPPTAALTPWSFLNRFFQATWQKPCSWMPYPLAQHRLSHLEASEHGRMLHVS